MSENQPTTANDAGVREHHAIHGAFPRVGLWIAVALVLGSALGAGIAVLRNSTHAALPSVSTLPDRPAATWAAGAKRAPDFSLVDQRGSPISLTQFRGRPVIVTFIDPACRSLCPLEAKELGRAVAATPAADRPVIVSVSVNPWADTRRYLRQDARHWHLGPEWRWALGRRAQLAPVWKRYNIGVLMTKRVIAGITVRDVSHTEASLVVDRAGFQRALFLFPFRGPDVAAVLKQLAAKRT